MLQKMVCTYCTSWMYISFTNMALKDDESEVWNKFLQNGISRGVLQWIGHIVVSRTAMFRYKCFSSPSKKP